MFDVSRMSVIAIDPGTKNLALCAITPEGKVVHWDVISISPDPKGIYEGLEKIKFSEWVKESSDVVVERQPSKNPRAVRIQHYIEMYAASNDGRMYCIDPKHKLSYASTTEWWPQRDITNWNYNERKKLSVETVKEYLKTTDQDQEFIELFDKSKKKDDLADSLLHALAFIHNIKPSLKETRTPMAVRNIKPKKPMESQMKSGKFSQAGLKFLAKGLLTSFDAFETKVSDIHGFCTSASKHFETLDNAYIQLGGKL
ncbi:Poxvirus A22-like protein [Paramecium bursaria Chlorella virus OR0704.2.2]|nr:Poxvirus A22-like protein [Paramecium bursaria Chlorella virus OR0704.2.2]